MMTKTDRYKNDMIILHGMFIDWLTTNNLLRDVDNQMKSDNTELQLHLEDTDETILGFDDLGGDLNYASYLWDVPLEDENRWHEIEKSFRVNQVWASNVQATRRLNGGLSEFFTEAVDASRSYVNLMSAAVDLENTIALPEQPPTTIGSINHMRQHAAELDRQIESFNDDESDPCDDCPIKDICELLTEDEKEKAAEKELAGEWVSSLTDPWKSLFNHFGL